MFAKLWHWLRYGEWDTGLRSLSSLTDDEVDDILNMHQAKDEQVESQTPWGLGPWEPDAPWIDITADGSAGAEKDHS